MNNHPPYLIMMIVFIVIMLIASSCGEPAPVLDDRQPAAGEEEASDTEAEVDDPCDSVRADIESPALRVWLWWIPAGAGAIRWSCRGVRTFDE